MKPFSWGFSHLTYDISVVVNICLLTDFQMLLFLCCLLYKDLLFLKVKRASCNYTSCTRYRNRYSDNN